MEPASTQLVMEWISGLNTVVLGFIGWMLKSYMDKVTSHQQQITKIIAQNTATDNIIKLNYDRLTDQIQTLARSIERLQDDIIRRDDVHAKMTSEFIQALSKPNRP